MRPEIKPSYVALDPGASTERMPWSASCLDDELGVIKTIRTECLVRDDELSELNTSGFDSPDGCCEVADVYNVSGQSEPSATSAPRTYT